MEQSLVSFLITSTHQRSISAKSIGEPTRKSSSSRISNSLLTRSPKFTNQRALMYLLSNIINYFRSLLWANVRRRTYWTLGSTWNQPTTNCISKDSIMTHKRLVRMRKFTSLGAKWYNRKSIKKILNH